MGTPNRGALVRARALALAILIAVVASVAIVSAPNRAEAAVGSDFDPGYIISDELFFDRYAMTAADIQAFLNKQIGTCTNGKCLNVLTVTFGSQTIVKSSGTGATICEPVTGGTMSAAEMIYRVQVACGISAKVILATLQKEQSLVSGSIARSPDDNRLNKAMGAACPDSGSGCDPAYSGFAKQIYRGALLLSAYRASAHLRKPGNTYTFQWKPNTDCGTVDIYIQNWATAALYNYTPYPPNQAALTNLYTSGDSCSSYGNRNFWRLYSDWFEDPRTGVPVGVTLSRTGGADRYESATLISRNQFTGPVGVVYVATGTNFPDALSAAPAAAMAQGPLLLVETNRVPGVVEQELSRLAPQKIVVVGGPAAVSDSVLSRLASFAPEVQRLGGADRYEVSRALVRATFAGTTSSVAYVATGANYPDALSASAAAGSLRAPVVLVPGSSSSIDSQTAALLQEIGVTEVRIVGGPAAVSSGIESSVAALPFITKVTRFSGSDRYVVSVAVNKKAFTSSDRVYLASGLDFPDALSGAVVAGIRSAPLYVVPSNCMPADVIGAIHDLGATSVTLLGGPGALGSQVASFRRC